MAACNIDVVKNVGLYLNTPVGPICFNTDRVLTTVLDKENVEGFVSIVLRLACRSGHQLSREQALLSYQWLEHLAMYADQSLGNPTFSKSFLKEINDALERSSYLTGQALSVADVAAYHVLYPLVDRLSVTEKESFLHLCRWLKHVQSQPKVCTNKAQLSLNTLNLHILAPVSH